MNNPIRVSIQRRSGALPRILFIGEAVSLAHVGRPAVLARWAREAGYHVYFACGSTLASVARAEGLTPHSLESIEAGTFHSRLNAGQFFYTEAELESYVRAELKLIEDIKPDFIVGDFRLTLAISAKLARVPLLCLNNVHWSPAAECRFPPPNAGVFQILPTALRDGLFSMIRPLVFRTFARPLNVLRRRFGLPPLNNFREHYTAGDYCAYLDLPEISPVSLPDGHFFLGPVVWEPRHIASFTLGNFSSCRPLAYVTLGSSGDVNVLPNVLCALLVNGFDIALSGVDRELSDAIYRSLPDLKRRCIAAPLLNPRDVLTRASVTVCHGGSGTVYQSLAAGVPLICIPRNPDQNLVSAAVQAKRAGLIIKPYRATLDVLATALNTLLTEARYTRSSRLLAEAIAHHDTRQRWLDLIHEIFPLLPVDPASSCNQKELSRMENHCRHS